MFIGSYQHSIDEKGRVIIPSRFREGLGNRPVITRGLDQCLFLFPLDEWEKQSRELASLPLSKADARAYSRLFFAGAAECELDKQGRIMIPTYLRDYAKLERDVVIIGVSSRIEIWALESWQEYSRQAEASYEEIAEHLVGIGQGIT
ncbi:MAG TPA: division/cell wall cluster transcriptional repressor MraZ [Firmicutes bacterium]|nr:division/cell wall cluster transcriptional repressor MraZ [Bacillota bacterium]